MLSVSVHETSKANPMGGGGGGLLGISSDREDQRIFWDWKFLIPGFLRVGKFGKQYFLG